MTRRERLELKLEKRRQWAESRRKKADEKYKAASAATDGIPFGQPILVGHHSEKKHRAAIDKSARNMDAMCESLNMAKHHESAAAGLESQLDSSIYSDDHDAVEQLEKRIASLESEREEMKARNVYWRKHKTMKGCPGVSDETAARLDVEIPAAYSWCRQPHPAYQLSNLSGNIGRLRKRLEHVKARTTRIEQAETSTNGVLIEGTEYVRVTFAEKPIREVLNALKAAGFRWGGGSWCGRRDQLPANIIDNPGE